MDKSGQLDAIFRPRAIAVIGASTRKGTIGREILHNLIEYEFNGKVFPVNPKAHVIHSIKCYSTILDVPDAVDLAIIIVPSEQVAKTLEQCGEKGVKGVVVITSGFKETGEKGAKKEAELVQIIRKYNMRMIGPNCFGVLNTDPQYSMNATFSRTRPLSGPVGFMSQSGALAETILNHANQLHLGFSMFASVGNKADISGDHILDYWGNDPGTKIILLYLESFGDPKRFTQIARGITRVKPIVAVKAGRTAAGARAVSSHTGALAGLDVGTDALFEQCGVLRVSSVDDLFDVAMALSNQPLPRGDRVAIITNAGGPGILATDAVVNLGLKMATFEKQTLRYLKANLPDMAAVHNPVDVIASGGAESYRVAMDAVLSDKNVDAVIVIFVPPIVVDHKAVIDVIIQMIEKHKNDKTVLGCFMAVPGSLSSSEAMARHKIPTYIFPESAAKALSLMVRYRKWTERPVGKTVRFKADRARVKNILNAAAGQGRSIIVGMEALDILASYGINVARSVRVKTQPDLEGMGARLKFPVVMKIDDPKIVHKTDIGGVTGELRTPAEAMEAFKAMKKKFSKPKDGFGGVIIQEMVRDGVETIIGMSQDPSFGPLMMFGLGGIYVEVMKDVAFKIHPLTDFDAREMIQSIHAFPLLTGFRGAAEVDLKGLEETILRLSQLVADFPQLESFDLNPFIATADRKTSKAVDARFVI